MTTLTDVQTLVGGAISATFGQLFTPILIIILFLGIAVYMRASFENVVIFMVALIAIMAMYGLLPISVVIAVIFLGSAVAFFFAKKLFGF